MISEFILDTIRRNNRIVDYLDSKGIKPVSRGDKRITYLCPIHKDSKPSFVVFLPQEIDAYEEYHCFGCKSRRCIIELYSRLENVSWQQAILALGKDIEISNTDEVDYIVEQLKREQNEKSIDDISNEVYRMSLNLSAVGFLHMKKTMYDIEEIGFLEKLYKKIDSLILAEDIKGLEKAYNFSLEHVVKEKDSEIITPFMYRYDNWENKKSEEAKQEINLIGG